MSVTCVIFPTQRAGVTSGAVTDLAPSLAAA